ncbi:GGDEF domain-containing protein, partial [Arthrospira platensis SPKY1]|nr:GGDEF domain-containing protein [Arthrospira platensis SPKY1]
MGALLMLDLDHYKLVNDMHGHPVGDQLLREVAHRLQMCLKSTDTLARIGGDEFMVLLEGIHSADDAGRVAERLLQALGTEPFYLFGNTVHTRASIGITLFPDDDI